MPALSPCSLVAAGAGLDGASAVLWSQGSGGSVDAAETGDTFGYSLAAGQIDGSGPTDLAIGVPNEDVGPASSAVSNAGAVHVVYGPLGAAGSELWTQDSAGVLDAAEAGDLFGLTVATGDFDGNGQDDLVAGVPLEDLGGIEDMGAVNVLSGPPGQHPSGRAAVLVAGQRRHLRCGRGRRLVWAGKPVVPIQVRCGWGLPAMRARSSSVLGVMSALSTRSTRSSDCRR